jgi:50S ribosomal protein L16 3-hydroxylase
VQVDAGSEARAPAVAHAPALYLRVRDTASLYWRDGKSASSALLGGLTAAAFVARHWHKAPLVVRGAMPGFAGVATRDELFALAARDDVTSRLVRKVREAIHSSMARSAARDSPVLPRRDFTLLVQGMNLHSDAADALLRRFAFIPHARLDDVMVSYAAPGGGVGPHVDSYDVFPAAGAGRRRWRYGRQSDLSLRRNLPLKILRRFEPTDDATLAPGDMLYLHPISRTRARRSTNA